MNLIRFAKATIVAAALVLATQSHAGPIVYGTYYEDTLPGNECVTGAGNTCQLYFSQTPSNKLVLVRNLSCYQSSTKQPYAAAINVSASLGGASLGRAQWIPYSPPLVSSLSLYAGVFQSDIRLLIGQGRFPMIQVFYNGTSSVATLVCSISGELVDPL